MGLITPKKVSAIESGWYNDTNKGSTIYARRGTTENANIKEGTEIFEGLSS
jgi:hypothetical protein